MTPIPFPQTPEQKAEVALLLDRLRGLPECSFDATVTMYFNEDGTIVALSVHVADFLDFDGPVSHHYDHEDAKSELGVDDTYVLDDEVVAAFDGLSSKFAWAIDGNEWIIPVPSTWAKVPIHVVPDDDDDDDDDYDDDYDDYSDGLA